MTDYQPLVSLADLADFPGAPFAQDVLDAAADAVRREAGWHIAPETTETITLDVRGGPVLILPTLFLSSVSEVRDMTGSTPVVLTGWRMSKAGMLSRSAGWPVGFSAVEVDMVHGYKTCPDSLKPIVARATSRVVVQESLGSRSVTYQPDSGGSLAAQVSHFRLPPLP